MPKLPLPHEHGPAWLVQAADIARQFFLEGRSKVDIADDLGLSRFKVARILDEARELGLVEVTIRLPAMIDAPASASLREHLGLRRAIVLSADAPRDRVREDLGRLAADLLTELVTERDVLGMSCSRTVTAASRALNRLDPCEVVQLTGTLAGVHADSGSVEAVRRAAELGGGRAWPIYAPMLLPDAATARALLGQEAIAQTLARAADVSVGLVAVGAWGAGLSTIWESATERERASAFRAGGVGEIGGRVFDIDGAPVTAGVDRRILGVRLEELRGMRELIVLAYDARRATAVRAAVQGGLGDTLVCDHALATELLEPTARLEAS